MIIYHTHVSILRLRENGIARPCIYFDVTSLSWGLTYSRQSPGPPRRQTIGRSRQSPSTVKGDPGRAPVEPRWIEYAKMITSIYMFY
jgi:hypothetical protein